MSDPYIGEIRMFGGTFAPRKWGFCNGTYMPISGNESLYSLITTLYGGDGRTTFALPEMRGRIPVHQGQGPGLTNRLIGQRYGVESVQLSTSQIPPHSHPMCASTYDATSSNAIARVLAKTTSPDVIYAPDEVSADLVALDDSAVSNTGSGDYHNNMMPYCGINFIICLQGIYPPRS